ncbi:MAG: PilZ domain-containing protein [Vulcanimicrobiota bacterium]
MNLFSGLKATFLGHPEFTWENRRRGARVRLRLPVTARQQQQQSNAELLDLSAHGLRLLSTRINPAGQCLYLTPQGSFGQVGRQRVKCQVAWCRPHNNRYLVGVRWDDSDSWIQELWRRVEPRWVPRRHLRVACRLQVQVQLDGECWSGLCHDLSPGGCRLRLAAHLSPGQLVRIGFGPQPWQPAIQLEARLVGRAGGEYCFRFAGQICPRLRGLLLNLLEAEAPLCDDPLLDEESLAPSACRMRAVQSLPTRPSLSSVFAPEIPSPRFESGLPRVIGDLRRRETIPNRNPSLWAARNLRTIRLADC